MITQQRVDFAGPNGLTLAGRLTLPEGTPRAWGAFAHCFTCGKDPKFLNRLARRLAEHGLAVLRFDFTGIGESRGDFAETNFTTMVADAAAAVDFLAAEHAEPTYLIGHSLGGAAAMLAAVHRPGLKALALINSPSNTHHLRGNLAALDPGLAEGNSGEVTLGGKRWPITPQFLADLEAHDVAAAAADLRAATLIFHSVHDVTVPFGHSHRLSELIASPCGLIPLADDHLLARSDQTTDLIADATAGWVGMWGG